MRRRGWIAGRIFIPFEFWLAGGTKVFISFFGSTGFLRICKQMTNRKSVSELTYLILMNFLEWNNCQKGKGIRYTSYPEQQDSCPFTDIKI
jgi:hypothetical protein